jgi:hypothetical protein
MPQRKDSPPRLVADTHVATPEEVQRAYEALTPTELVKLRNFADRRIRGLARMALGRSSDGLLHEAITRVLQDKRHWKSENVDFPQYLKGVIQSVSSNWRAKFKRWEAGLGQGDGVTITEISLGASGPDDPELQLTSPEPDQERVLLARDEVEWLQDLVKDHLYASAILDEMLEGRTGPETQGRLGITQTEYESTVKWIKNNARRAKAKEGDNAE